MSNSSFYSTDELLSLNLKAVGTNVKISRKASIYGKHTISIGNNVRIDDFSILSGNINISNNVHIAAYTALYGGTAGIYISNYANLSSRVCIYAVSDDYSGYSMTNPTIPDEYKHVINFPVKIGKHVIIGSGSTVLPGVELRDGTALGAMTLCKESTDEWTIYVGIPARKLKHRDKHLLVFADQYEKESII